jgi:hypothetical protein
MVWSQIYYFQPGTLFFYLNSNPEFQKSVKELNEKIGVVADDLRVK